MNKRIIAIIPARSGSKGLKDKNVKQLNGKPLLAYTIEAARDSGLFDNIHVSTDSETYASIAKEYGFNVPFLRSAENSSDVASSWDAVREVIDAYEKIGEIYDICVLLQPTSPMRTSGDINNAYRLYVEKKANSLVSVTEVEHPVQWCFCLDKTLSMKEFARSPYKDIRRQDLQTYYRENGAIYIVDVKKIKKQPFDFYSDKCVAFIMDRDRSIDIDSITDFMLAETMIKLQLEEK